jgi:hypothetical protein
MADRARLFSKGAEINKEDRVATKQRSRFSHPSTSPINQVLFLQRTLGNQAVQGLFKSGVIQAKLKIGHRNDIEQKADRVAEQVMRMPESKVQRQSKEEEPLMTESISSETPSEEISVSFTTCPWTCEDCDKWEKEELEKDKSEKMRRATRNKYKGCRDSVTKWETEKVYEFLKKNPEFWRIFRMVIITTAVNRAEIKDPKVKAEYDESRRRELWEFYHRNAIHWAWYRAWGKAGE